MSDYFMETQAHEWILSSKNGSYSLGTGNLLNQRKYNGLLIKSDTNFQRILLVSSIEEQINWRGDYFHIDSSHYNNCIFPEGFLHLVKSWLRPYPVFLYSSLPHNDDIMIKKEIMIDKNSSIVLVKYTNLGSHTLHFKIRPKFALRNHHYLNEKGIFDKILVHADFKEIDKSANTIFSAQRTDTNVSVFGWLQHGRAIYDRVIYRDVYYPWEAYRGYPANEDLIAPLCFEFEIKVNESNYLLFSDKNITDPLILADAIEKRYKKLPLPIDVPIKRKKQSNDSLLASLDYNDNVMFNHDDYLKILELSMKDFLANDDIIAGFPWFGAWGRDTMIALEGVLQLPKGAEIGFKILEKYARQIKNGLIPNMCNESHQAANYISIDATLWFIIRLYEITKSLNETSNEAKKIKLERWKYVIKLTEQVLESILEKTNENFFIREDGLLELKENFASATWMDAKIDNVAVTPRNGAPVEINALLFNAISSYEKMTDLYNEISPDRDNILTNQMFLEAGQLIQQSFKKFWIEDYLADRIVGDLVIKEYRPNAIIATSLPFTDKLLSIDKIRQVYETAHVELFTPYGIRSLSPKDSKFKRKYIGSVTERDKAYHQGTVWGWLLLPFVKTWLWANPNLDKEASLNHISYLIERFRNGYMKGHIASVAEVWDGDKPHFPKGCPAQAWSVSALYCIEKIIIELKGG